MGEGTQNPRKKYNFVTILKNNKIKNQITVHPAFLMNEFFARNSENVWPASLRTHLWWLRLEIEIKQDNYI